MELSVLGFIGLSTFVVVRGEVLTVVFSKHVAHELLEVFESVHIFIFCVMCVFFLVTIHLVEITHRFIQQCAEYEKPSWKDLCRAYTSLREEGTMRSYFRLRAISHVLQYRMLRMEFLDPKGLNADVSTLPNRFPFGIYLKGCCVEVTKKLPDFKPMQYLQLMVLLIPLGVVIQLAPRSLALTLGVVIPLALGAFSMRLRVRLAALLDLLCPSIEENINKVVEDDKDQGHLERNPSMRRVDSSTARMFIEGGVGTPESCGNHIRLLLLLLSVNLAAIIFMSCRDLSWAKEHIDCVVVGPTIIIAVLGVELPAIIKTFTVSSSIEDMKNKRQVTATLRLMEQRSLAEGLELLASLRRGCIQAINADFNKEQLLNEYEHLGRLEQRQINEAFEAADKDKSGSIDASELLETMASVGITLSKEDAQTWFEALGRSSLSLEDFKAVSIAIKRWRTQPLTMEDLQQFFSDLDVDGDGRLSAEELLKGFEQAGASMTLSKCEALVEAAAHHSGAEDHKALGLHDLEGWLKHLSRRLDAPLLKHSHKTHHHAHHAHH